MIEESTVIFEYFNIICDLLKQSAKVAFPTENKLTKMLKYLDKVFKAVKDFMLSILIDIEVLQFRPSIVIAGLFSAAFELPLHAKLASIDAMRKSGTDLKKREMMMTIAMRLVGSNLDFEVPDSITVTELRDLNQIWE